MSTDEIPRWVKTWGSIVGAMTGTLIMLSQFTNLFNKPVPVEPAPINVIIPDVEPTVMPVLRHIEDGVYRLHKEMGIEDTNNVGKVDSISIDSVETAKAGGTI